jgi:hypothetical protein
MVRAKNNPIIIGSKELTIETELNFSLIKYHEILVPTAIIISATINPEGILIFG